MTSVSRLTALLVASSVSVFAQQLSLSSASATPGNSIALALSLNTGGGTSPAGAQWTVNYSAVSFTQVQVTAGPASVAAGKSVQCNGSSGSLTCLATATNSSTIASGQIATITLSVSPSAVGVLPVQLTNGVAVSSAGKSISITTSGGSVSVQPPPLTLSSLTCSPGQVTTPANATCTVSLSGPAPAGGVSVGLKSASSSVAVPGSVSVAAGASSANFTAAAAQITQTTAVQLTATANSVSQTFSLTLLGATLPTLSSLQCNPDDFKTPGTTTCTVSLSGPAPAGGFPVNLQSGSAALTVPNSVSVASGASTANFNAVAGPVAQKTIVQLTAAANTVSRTFAVILFAPTVTLSGLTCSPAQITTPGNATCTVALTGPAPTGGFPVNLQSMAGVTAPGSVSVAAGLSNANFNAIAAQVAQTTTVQLTATAGSSSQTFALTLQAPAAPPPTLSNLTCSPSQLTTPGSAACSVTLTSSAPAGGVSVGLQSGSASVTVPGSASVAAGASSANFTAVAAQVTQKTTAQLTATLGGSSKTFALTLDAPAPILSNLTCSPAQLTTPGNATCTVTLTNAAPAGGVSVGLQSGSASVTVPGSASVAAAASSANFTAVAAQVAEKTTTQLTATLSGSSKTFALTLDAPAPTLSNLTCSPAQLTTPGNATCTVTLTNAAPAGGFSVSLQSGREEVAVPTTVTVAGGASSANFGALAAEVTQNTTVPLTATAAGSSQTFALTLLGPAPTLSSVSCKPDQFTVPGQTSCTVSLSGPAPVGGLPVNLKSGAAALTVPDSVLVDAGKSSVTFNADAAPVRRKTKVQLTASANGLSRKSQVTLLNAAQLNSLTCDPTSSNSSQTTCTVSLTGPAPTGGLNIALQSDSTVIRLPQSALVREGRANGTFTVATRDVGEDTQVLLIASLDSFESTALLSLGGPPVLSSLKCHPNQLEVGGAVDCTVELTNPANAGGSVVLVVSDNPRIRVPASVSIPDGESEAVFQISADSRAALGNAEISVNAETITRTTQLRVVLVRSIPHKIGVFRAGTWMIDYDGEGVWQEPPAGNSFRLSDTTDVVPVVGGWNGSGTDKAAVFLSDGRWMIDFNGNGQWDGPGVDRVCKLGQAGDVPVIGDWDGSGSHKIGVFRKSLWLLDSTGQCFREEPADYRSFKLGGPRGVPVVGDWNGSGSDKVGVFEAGLWTLDFNGNGVWDGRGVDRLWTLGGENDSPIVGDWSGSGTDKIGTFAEGLWMLDLNGNGAWEGEDIDQSAQWGDSLVVPVVGDWDGSGAAKIGAFADGTWTLDWDGNAVWSEGGEDRSYTMGKSGDIPLSGRW